MTHRMNDLLNLLTLPSTSCSSRPRVQFCGYSEIPITENVVFFKYPHDCREDTRFLVVRVFFQSLKMNTTICEHRLTITLHLSPYVCVCRPGLSRLERDGFLV